MDRLEELQHYNALLEQKIVQLQNSLGGLFEAKESKIETKPAVAKPSTKEPPVVLPEILHQDNLSRLYELFELLEINQKVEKFEDIFGFKAMNISGLSLSDESFGEIQSGRYVQIIVSDSGKNRSLGYYGKSDTIVQEKKELVMEFVLRWRYEKALQKATHYKNLLARIDKEI